MRRALVSVLALLLLLGLVPWGIGQQWAAAQNAVKEDMVQKITAAMPTKALAQPACPRKLLVFNLARGFVHDSIPVAAKAFEIMGQKTGAFEVVCTKDVSIFEPDKLKAFDAVMMNNTTGEIFGPPPPAGRKPTPEQKKAAALCKSLCDFVAGGKGLCGIHSATDWAGWTDYGQLFGAQFLGHPYSEVVCKNEDPSNPINASFKGKEFSITDEMYTFKEKYTRKDLHILLSIDVDRSNIKNQVRKDQDYWVSWIRPVGKGRVFYCSFGHNHHIFTNKQILRHYLAGIQYALGDLKVDDALAAPGVKAISACRTTAPRCLIVTSRSKC